METETLNIDQILSQVGESVITKYRELLNTTNTNASGNLSNSLRYYSSNDELLLELADYWQYVEDGRLPGSPVPISAISNWIANKGLPQQRDLSWAIAKSIAKKGIVGKHLLEQTLEAVEPELDQYLEEAVNNKIDSIWI